MWPMAALLSRRQHGGSVAVLIVGQDGQRAFGLAQRIVWQQTDYDAANQRLTA
jgi:hypothetical protein